MTESLLNGRVTLHLGDCLDKLARLEECSIDSCVTDPPYHLTNNTGTRSPYPGQYTPIGQPKKPKGGFMGKQWDGGDIAFRPDLWAAVYRVLKPGAHLVAMGGTRTYHRMACAIEDAGFEIRDTISWLYGSGFPKSHDVSKGIDKSDAVQARLSRQFRFTEWMRSTGLTAARIDDITNTFMGNHYTTHPTQPAVPARDLFEMLRPHIDCAVPSWVEALIDERTVESENFKRREVLAHVNGTRLAIAPGQGEDRGDIELAVTAGHTDAARKWAGWGTALKPACELIVLARKPLSEGTVAANVLRWGTGAINVDGCRVTHDDPLKTTERTAPRYSGLTMNGGKRGGEQSVIASADPLGRWPANLVHDGSDEVVAAFPESDGNSGGVIRDKGADSVARGKFRETVRGGYGGDNGGSAARFFYTAKADADDRLGSKHPTVKPVDLMQWLVRLVTPRGGTVLDLFAGTGTTGEAAWREGMRAVLIEREAEYQEDIRRRMKLALGGPEERAREAIKARMQGKPIDNGPLFAEVAK